MFESELDNFFILRIQLYLDVLYLIALQLGQDGISNRIKCITCYIFFSTAVLLFNLRQSWDFS